jgi:hypothetical protein
VKRAIASGARAAVAYIRRMKLVIAAFVAIATAASPALAQQLTTSSTREAAATFKELATDDAALAVSITGVLADADGTLSSIVDTDNVDALGLRCVARQARELVAATADPIVLDGLVGLAGGHVELRYLDLTQLGFDPLARDRRFDYGVVATPDRVVVTAVLRRSGCTVANAAQLATSLRALHESTRVDPGELAAATRTLLDRVRARGAARK